MKNYYKLLLTSIMCLLLNFSFAQISTEIQGHHEVVSGTDIQYFDISQNKVEAYVGKEMVEKFFFFKQEGDTYILERTALDVENIDTSIKKDRKLLKIQVKPLANGQMALNIIHPNGMNQEIIMKKAD